MKNVGDTLWENRYYECNHPMMELMEMMLFRIDWESDYISR